MKITMRHVYDSGKDRERVGAYLVRPGSWDAIRETAGPFGLADTRAAWELDGNRDDLRARGSDIALLGRCAQRGHHATSLVADARRPARDRPRLAGLAADPREASATGRGQPIRVSSDGRSRLRSGSPPVGGRGCVGSGGRE